MLAAGVLSSCSTAPGSGAGRAQGKGGEGLSFWSHSPNLEPLNKRTIATFAASSGGVPVEYGYHETAKMGQALQLAKQSGQLPDVTTNVGLSLPAPALVKEGWFQPVQLTAEAKAYLDEHVELVEGIHTFGGDVYTFPGFSTKQYFTVNWFNKELVEKAGLDPDGPPESYDEFRAACRAVQKVQKGVSAWVANLGQLGRLGEQVHFLAQAAGFEGENGFEFRTGQAAFDSEPYVTAIEFLLSLQKDGLLMPGSINLIDNQARSRWAAGAAGYFFDGPWCPGVVKSDLAAFSDKVGSGPMIRPDKGTPVSVYRGPQGGLVWVTGSSQNPEAAGRFLSMFASNEYAQGIAEGMGQPPADLGAVDRVDVHPAYKKAMGWFAEDCFVAPVPVGKNTEAATVLAEEKDIAPGLPEIVQGAFSGDVKDVRKALKDYTDKRQAERERALKVATAKGAKVSMEDFAFPDWTPRKDYTYA
jgi:multiple sugar transport system substrate-binding protein